MGRHRRQLGIVSGVAAGAVVLGVLSWGLLGGADTATAMPTEQGFCSARQVEAHMEGIDRAASVVHAAVQITARPGQSCRLTGAPPATLVGAPGVAVVRDQNSSGTTVVDATHAAHVELTWASTGSPAQQVTPRSVSLEMPGVAADSLAVAWRGGPVDGPAVHGHVTVHPFGPGFATAQG